MTKSELDWVYTKNGAAKFLPEAWRSFEGIVPISERSDLIAAYNKRLFGSSPSEQAQYARAWTVWENSLASVQSCGTSHIPTVATPHMKMPQHPHV